MDISTVKTIACIVPTEKPNERKYVPQSFISYNVNQKRLFQEYELSMTVERKTDTWIVDQVTNQFSDETAKLVDSALSGYSAACLLLSVRDECKEALDKQRKQNLRDVFDYLKRCIEPLRDSFTIEYAYLGIEDSECYDCRKEASRTNISVLQRGMDGIMKAVNNIDEIISNVMDQKLNLPTILNIRLTDNEKKTSGRLVIADLLHPRFTPLLPGMTHPIHESFEYFKYIVETLASPNCTTQCKTNDSVLTNEIIKYICGKNRLIIVGYINDKIVNEIHSKETRSLLSFLELFKDIPVRSLASKSMQETFEYKSFLIEKKKKEHHHNELLSTSNKLKQHLLEKDLIISELETDLDNKRLEFSENDDTTQGYREKKVLLDVRDKQIEYLKATMNSKAAIYDFDKLELKTDIVRLKTMLDIKEFAQDDFLFESESRRRHHQEHLSTIRNKVEEKETEVSDLEKKIRELRRKIIETESQPPPPPISPAGKIKNITGQQLKLEELRSTVAKVKKELDETIEESRLHKETLDDRYAKDKENAAKHLSRKRKEVKDEIANIKEVANQKMSALNRKFQDKLAQQEKEIEELRAELLKAREPKRKRGRK